MRPPTEIYYWPRCFLLRSTDFQQNKPYRRISTTLITALDGDFAIETEDRGRRRCGAMVLGPAARRLALHISSPAVLIEAEPLSPQHLALLQVLQHAPSREIDGEPLRRLRDTLAEAARPLPDPQRAPQLQAAAVAQLAELPGRVDCEPRVRQVLDWLEEAALDEVSLSALARRAGLSESRLRSLARKQLGCPLSQYVRWLAAWNVAMYWRPGITLTDAAHAAGFHDLSHANHAFNEMFGMSPSRVLKPEVMRLVNCASPA